MRSRLRAEQPGPHDSPAIGDSVAEWCEGEITDPDFVAGLCDGGDRVVSALGVTTQPASPWDVDYRANLALLEDAERASVRSFLYVNVMNADAGTSLIMPSKSAFQECLERSSLSSQIINPSGFFSDFAAFLDMARRGVVLLPPDEQVRIAPIHGVDLAEYSVDKVGDRSGSWDVGGPEDLTFKEIAIQAFDAAGRTPRLGRVPMPAINTGVWLASRAGARQGDLTRFLAEQLTQDAVGENYGARRLADYFALLTRIVQRA